ncbi:hypothetical protein P3L10_013582 [Capsicum annuum]
MPLPLIFGTVPHLIILIYLFQTGFSGPGTRFMQKDMHGMTFRGLSQSTYLFMVDQITMTTITVLGAKPRAILLQFSLTVITYMELIRAITIKRKSSRK